MRIFHIERQRSWTGQTARLLREATALRDRGFEVGLLCHPGGELERRAREAGVEALAFPMRGLRGFGVVPGAARALRGRGVDVVHAHGGRDHALGAAIARLLGARFLLRTKHNHTRLRSGAWNRALYNRTDRVVAVSRFVADRLIEVGVRPERVTTIHTGVDPARFAPRPRDPETARALGLAPGEIAVGMVSSLHERKGPDLLLRAFRALLDAAPERPLRCVLVGKNPGRWEALARELELGDRARFPGPREDVPSALACLDLFVAPSREEALGTAILEAMACGLPVVAARVGGIVEAVTPETGALVPPEDPKALAVAMGELLAAAPDRRRALGAAGRARVLGRFTHAAFVDASEALYRSLAPPAR